MKIDPYITKGEIKSGDVFVICSDGVSDVLTPDELYEAASEGSACDCVTEILSKADKKQGQDNATAIVIKIK